MASPEPAPGKRELYTVEAIPADTGRALFLANPQVDHLFAAMTALTAEVWTVRRRLATVEALLREHGSVTAESIEKHEPTASEAAQWAAERDQFVRRIFDPFVGQADIPFTSSRTSR